MIRNWLTGIDPRGKYLAASLSVILFMGCAAQGSANFTTAHPENTMGEGWEALLSDNLSNCIYNQGSWSYDNGVLSLEGDGDIWTEDRYGDFILDLEFRVSDDCNSGIFLRTGSIENWLHTAIEMQVFDSSGKKEVGKHDCGAIYDCLAPRVNAIRQPGEWNRCTITCDDNKIYIVLNGQQIIDMDLNRWTEAHRNPDGTKNKFNTAYRDMPRVGHIGFQDHGHPIWYRNIRIQEL
ncbi:MAG TPA: DUF1080 domain-containing protein [bacterium]|nr:DUF1080 domain-containing protein [bacterium]